ncbi:superinfection immunity protein [Phreatobacter stygius]|uniref:Superinfection immunity protein n=1 Tax=Phreatobacter stygius TaxID=1940610 RepID=A0A4D7AZQ0_9HYPH|nr:superinfection immunity protein [Phreatobacter stygius]QCI63240.1 superinfection immunity protein [Phreatobacter stygius]
MDGLVILLLVILVGIYFIPTIVAFSREHDYRWVICALNIVGGWTFVLWGVALVWAVYPTNKTFADPLIGSATGLGIRNTGDVLGEADFGRQRGYSAAQLASPAVVAPPRERQGSVIDALERLQKLRDSGVLTQDEFEIQKREVLK